MKRIPIKLRVTLVFAAVMAIVLAAAGLFLYLRLESSLNNSTDTELQSRTQQLIREMRVNDRGLGEAARNLIDRRPSDFAQVLTSTGHLFDPSHQQGQHPALSPPRVPAAGDGQITFEHPTRSGVPERYLARPFGFEGHSLIAVAGTSLQSRDDALDSLLTLLLIGGPIALILSFLAAYWTVGSALRPVEAMRRRASEVSASGSHQRLPVPAAQDELRMLGVTLNRMLDRLETALERERAFVDDASHELRTPLAAHKAELELALRYGASTEELRTAIASAIEEADRLAQLAESLLVIARSDKGKLALKLERVAIPEVFATLHDRLGSRADRDGRSLVFDDGAPGVVEADRMRLEQALANLVENALRYGEGTVRVWSRPADGRMELHVSDEGPGFPPEFLPYAFERFRRADTARSGDGTGLGLAIVKAIAQAHGGRARARNTSDGGADVWIDLAHSGPLPRAQETPDLPLA
ncbi:MAG: ATP-binding protein [Solirubrobacterales bacterium]